MADVRDPIALHSDGVQAYRAGHLEMAADLITKAIAANGHMPDFHYNLAIVLRAQGKLKEAAASYQRAILLKPDYAEAHNNLGNVWKDAGQTGQGPGLLLSTHCAASPAMPIRTIIWVFFAAIWETAPSGAPFPSLSGT